MLVITRHQMKPEDAQRLNRLTHIKMTLLFTYCVIYQTTLDITAVVNQLAAAGHPVDPENLATISPYLTEHIRRFGEWILDTTPPDPVATTRLHVGLAA